MKGRNPREGYPWEPRTLGGHLKKRRMDLGLRQRDVGRAIGATVQTVANWENGRSEPELKYYPAILSFLDYDTSLKPETLGERIRAARRRDGLSQRAIAERLEVDYTTVQAWEEETV